MDYKLTKRLKDAGFPQKKHNTSGKPFNVAIQWYSPTLSELIKECGDEFVHLTRYKDGWIAFATTKTSLNKTPEEAVARLYIELKK